MLLVVAFLIFMYALVRLVITKRHPRPGDEIVVRVFPPKIEIRYRDAASSPDAIGGDQPERNGSVVDARPRVSRRQRHHGRRR
ncbi:MAG TPA: hypothetical protein VM677_03300 [Actinokineospora sp.]|nr:hypothetical protein [Actinokineospora sp.]